MNHELLKVLTAARDELAKAIADAEQAVSGRRLPARTLAENATTPTAKAIAKMEHDTMQARWEATRAEGVPGNPESKVFLVMVEKGFVEDSPEGMETFLAWQGMGLAFLPAGEPFTSFRAECNAAWARHR